MGNVRVDDLKRSVIREELVKLTGDFKKAVLLNQLIYWSARTKDTNKYMQEEKERAAKKEAEIDIKKSSGWIYKKADEISEETMLGLSPSNISTHLKALIENEWLYRRRNPDRGWDKTFQYRVNLVKIIKDLYNLGFALKEYPVLTELVILSTSKIEIATSETENDTSKMEDNKSLIDFDDIQTIPNSKTENRNSKTEITTSEIEIGNSKTENRNSEIEEQYHRLLAENTNRDYTQETTTKIESHEIHNDKSKEEEKENKIKYVEDILCLRLEDRQRKLIGTFDMEKLEKSVALATTYTGKTNEEIIRILIAIYNNPANHRGLTDNGKIRAFNKYKKFNNYNQRTYDFDDLEKKLLGWDND